LNFHRSSYMFTLAMLAERFWHRSICTHNTHHLVQSLESIGLTSQQAEAINGMIIYGLKTYEDALKEEYVGLNEYEEFQTEHSKNLMKLKNDLQISRIKEYVQSKTLHDQVNRDLLLGRQRCRETLGMIKSEIKLDMSIERGHQKDKQASINMKIQNLSARFESDAASCLSSIQRIRQETMYTIVGYLFTSVAAFLGFLRLMKN
jgi:hypothetical protein